ncbi:hypothetical protein GCM10009654_42770 [Streptomyces hebeiensis]|uniref:Uncharacterized protein n=1 Tax=Streptomyces hebeiensis TaxID=229486 RepID=A0ABN1V1F4_9ACTN
MTAGRRISLTGATGFVGAHPPARLPADTEAEPGVSSHHVLLVTTTGPGLRHGRPVAAAFAARPTGGGTAPCDERVVFTAVVYVLTSG